MAKKTNQKDGRIRKNVTIGSTVQVMLKQDEKNGHLTKGVVAEIMTSGAKDKKGIKVRLQSGKVGRIKKILSVKVLSSAGNWSALDNPLWR